ACNDENYA
nr:Chain C, ssrA peptide [synthetic construct]1TWB_D Chain D, ssrA peptide [synthetic construct]